MNLLVLSPFFEHTKTWTLV